jgi:hypothetical protein
MIDYLRCRSCGGFVPSAWWRLVESRRERDARRRPPSVRPGPSGWSSALAAGMPVGEILSLRNCVSRRDGEESATQTTGWIL